MTTPTNITDQYWVYHPSQFLLESDDIGKWMLFYPKISIDQKWVEFCHMYNINQLNGIIGMKVSTNKINDRSSDIHNGVIILYCNNSSDKNHIISVGKNLLLYLKDYIYSTIYYKTNTQTSCGTRAIGQTTNHLYKLSILNKSDQPPLFSWLK